MNIIVGMMMPLMNWARKLAWCSWSLRSAKARSASARRPKTLTSSWPVQVSSTTALTSPVLFHCWTKCVWLRLPMAAVTSMVTGIVTRAMSASSGEIHTIIETIATTVSSEVSSWLRVC